MSSSNNGNTLTDANNTLINIDELLKASTTAGSINEHTTDNTSDKINVSSNKQNIVKYNLRHYTFLVLSALLIAFNINAFIKPASLSPGGMSGLTILLQTCFERFFSIQLPYSLVNFTINLFPVYIGFRYIGKRFTLDSCINIVLAGIFADIIPTIRIVDDPMLLTVFGGFIQGVAISLALSTEATTGGFDFISIFLSEKKNKDSWNYILVINSLIIISSGALYGWQTALYSVIFQYINTQVLHTFHKDYQKQTLLVITNKPQEISDALYGCTHHGATVLKGIGPHEKCERTVVYSVISRSQVKRAIRTVKLCDPSAGINSIRSEEFDGNFYMAPRV